MKEIRQQNGWEDFPNALPGGSWVPDYHVDGSLAITAEFHRLATLADSESAMEMLHICQKVHGKVTNAAMEKLALLVSLHGVEEYSAALGRLKQFKPDIAPLQTPLTDRQLPSIGTQTEKVQSPLLDTSAANERSDPDMMHVGTSSDVTDECILVSDIAEIGGARRPIKIEDDVDEEVKPAVVKARLLDDLKHLTCSARRPKLDDGLNRLTYDMEYFGSPAGLKLRTAIVSCQKECHEPLFSRGGFPLKEAWIVLIEVIEVLLVRVQRGPGCIRPDHFGLGLSEWPKMHGKIEEARLTCDRAILERDEETRPC